MNQLKYKASAYQGNLQYRNLSKTNRVKAVFDKRLGIVRKSGIAAFCSGISETAIGRALEELPVSGFVGIVGKCKATGYVRK